MPNEIYITKAGGEKEIFQPQKLINSLLRSKASEAEARDIAQRVEREIKEGATTKEIYHKAFDILEREQKPAALRYSLRKAIMELGPTGFPFENFVAEIFRAKGFETTTDFTARGECAEHEIDITAWNKEKLLMIEAKFHNELGIKSDLKTVLYVKARWDDLASKEFEGFGPAKRLLDEGWLITNTKFSESAVKYAECRGMKLVGWNYPARGSLQDLIEESRLHPITCLRSLSPSEKKILMELGIVLCRQAIHNIDLVEKTSIHKEKIKRMEEEINGVL